MWRELRAKAIFPFCFVFVLFQKDSEEDKYHDRPLEADTVSGIPMRTVVLALVIFLALIAGAMTALVSTVLFMAS